MKDAVYKIIGINGTSSTSIEDAINWAIKRAHETLRNLHRFEIMETRGKIKAGMMEQWQVTIKVGFPSRIDPASKVTPHLLTAAHGSHVRPALGFVITGAGIDAWRARLAGPSQRSRRLGAATGQESKTNCDY